MDYNRWQGIGRLTKKPKFHKVGRKGQPHCTFTLAVNAVVPNEEGPTVDYIPIALWGPEAEQFCLQRDKGDEVGVFGRIKTRLVIQADGTRNYFWEVRADRVSYGRQALGNLRETPYQDRVTQAVTLLTQEFGVES